MEDRDFAIYAFYLPRGFKLDYLINLSIVEKLMYKASMDKYYEEEMEKYKAILGEE